MFQSLVVDIASYTSFVDPLPLLEGGVELAIIKVDNKFKQNASRLHKAGMPCAAYVWIDPTLSVTSQVTKNVQAISDSGLPIELLFPDFEQYWSKWDEWYQALQHKLPWKKVSSFDSKFLSGHAESCVAAYAEEFDIAVYTSKGFVETWAPQSVEWLNNYKLWISHYAKQPAAGTVLDWQSVLSWLPDYFPLLPSGIDPANVIGHQFTGDKISLPGLYDLRGETRLYSAVDLSVFNSTWLKQFTSPVPSLLSPVLPPPARWIGIVTAYPSLRVRSAPNPTAPVIYSIPKGEKVDIIQRQYGWAQIRSFDTLWCSDTYLQLTPVLEPVSPLPAPSTPPPPPSKLPYDLLKEAKLEELDALEAWITNRKSLI